MKAYALIYSLLLASCTTVPSRTLIRTTTTSTTYKCPEMYLYDSSNHRCVPGQGYANLNLPSSEARPLKKLNKSEGLRGKAVKGFDRSRQKAISELGPSLNRKAKGIDCKALFEALNQCSGV